MNSNFQRIPGGGSSPEPADCSAGFQPAVSPTSSRPAQGKPDGRRIGNPRHSRLEVCATRFKAGEQGLLHEPERRPPARRKETRHSEHAGSETGVPRPARSCLGLIIAWACWLGAFSLAAGEAPRPAKRGPSVENYASIQEAIDANPGRMVFVPAGDYVISEKLRIHRDNSGLFGPGRIIQTSSNHPIIEIERATGVQLRDLTLTRAEGKMETKAEGVIAIQCRELALDNLRVLDNRSRSAAIALRECSGSRITGCLVQNYMRISVDDRTASADWGYAFNCIDGTGIGIFYGSGTLIQGNRVIEKNLLPTPEIKQKFDLGKFVKKNPKKGLIASQKTWDEEYASNWHQGSAIVVTAPDTSDYTQILGNTIENAAQGIDLHADHVIVSQNIINNSFMGMKAMHGSRHVLIIGNQFSKNDLWSIGLMPGAASHAAAPARDGGRPVAANVDGGSIIANNIISDFGYGHAHWIWGNNGAPLRFDRGQKPENPPLTDVIIQGNIVYDTGRDQVIVDGQPKVEPPRYKYAVIVEGGSNGPRGLHFSNNILHPGTQGISNVELKP